MIIKPEKLSDHNEQVCHIDGEEWRTGRLINLSKDLPVFDLPIAHIDLSAGISYDKMSARLLVAHCVSINKADLSYPVILSENGEIMDGRHRIMKAIMDGLETVKAVRFEENPSCDWRS